MPIGKWRKRNEHAGVLKLAVIIPSLNEELNLPQTLNSVAGQGVHQVIVVDGGSTDKTVAVAKAHGAKVIRSRPGRGVQLNAGWHASKSDWCLFLHADTQLPDNFNQMISTAVQQQQQPGQQHFPRCWGCFRSIQLTQVPVWQSRLVEAAVGLRTLLLRQPYGDQAIFVRRQTLEEMQGFKDWQFLEDVDMVQRLNRLSPPAVVPYSVATSSRRYRKRGFWQTVLLNQVILCGWAAGLDNHTLAAWYEHEHWPLAVQKRCHTYPSLYT